MAIRTLGALRAGGGNGPVALLDLLLGSTAISSGYLSVSSPSLGGLITDSTGKLTYKGNNLLLNSATLSTQSVTVPPGRFILSIKGTGSVALTGASTAGPLNGTGAANRVDLPFSATAGSLTLTVTGSVTSARLSAVTYETTFRAADDFDTTASAYYGPAFDYDPVSVGTPLGLRIWEARTNSALYSQTFSNAAWLVTGTGAAKVGVAPVIDPAGTNNAYEINVGSTGGAFDSASAVYQGNISITSGQSNTFAIWLRASTSTTSARIGIAVSGVASANSGDITLTTAWQRFVVTGLATGSTATGNISIRPNVAGTTGQTIYVWQADVNLNTTFAGPPIPTAASAVTAAADVVTLTGPALAVLQGATVSGVLETANVLGGYLLSSAGNNVPLYWNSLNQVGTLNNTAQSLVATFGTGNFTGVGRTGFAKSGAGRSLVAGGGTVATDANAFATITAAYLGSNGSSASINGYIRKLALYSSRLPDATLQSKTVSGAPF